MIIMLGQGILYQIHRNRQQWLTERERRRVTWMICGIVAALMVAALVLILKQPCLYC